MNDPLCHWPWRWPLTVLNRHCSMNPEFKFCYRGQRPLSVVLVWLKSYSIYAYVCFQLLTQEIQITRMKHQNQEKQTTAAQQLQNRLPQLSLNGILGGLNLTLCVRQLVPLLLTSFLGMKPARVLSVALNINKVLFRNLSCFSYTCLVSFEL